MNTIDEAIAMTVAANNATQDPESTGSALKVVSMRIRGTSADELEEAGEDTEGLITTTSKLAEKVKYLTAVNGKMGVSILDVNGNYRSTYEILSDIGNLWEEIGEADVTDGLNRQAALLEMLAGKTRAQSLASLLQSVDDLNNVYKDVQNSSGSAAKEQDRYMESIEAHMNTFTAKLQEMWNNTISSGMVNFFIDLGSGVLDVINEIGGLVPVLISLSGAFLLLKKTSGLSEVRTGLASFIKTIVTVRRENDSLTKTLKELGSVSLQGLINSIKAIKSMSIFGKLALVTGALTVAKVAIDYSTTSTKDLRKEASKFQSEYNDLTDEVKNLNSELDTTQDRISELEGMKNLSIVEQAELDTLKETNNQLERQIKYKEILAREAKANAAKASAEAIFGDNFEYMDLLLVGKEASKTEYEKANLLLEKVQGSKNVADYYDNEMKIIEQKYANNASEYMRDESWKRNKEKFDEVTESYRDRANAIQEMMGDINEDAENFYNTDGSVVAGYEEQAKLYEQLRDLFMDVFSTAEEKAQTVQNKINNVFDDTAFKGLKEELINLGKEGSLSIDDIVSSFPELINALSEAGIEVQTLYDYIMNLADPEGINEAKRTIEDSVYAQLKGLSTGNVDLTKRPKVDSETMAASGWEIGKDSYATTNTMGEFIWQGSEKDGEYVYVHYTPILPNGEVLSQEELDKYLHETLEGSNNVLESDNKGIVLKVDNIDIPETDIKKFLNGVDSQLVESFLQSAGEIDDTIHEVQESYYNEQTTELDGILKRLAESGATVSRLANLNFDDTYTTDMERYFTQLMEYLGLSEDQATALINTLSELGVILNDVPQPDKNEFTFDESQTQNLSDYQSMLSDIQNVLSDLDSLTDSDILSLTTKYQDADWKSYYNGTKSLKQILYDLSKDEMDSLSKKFPQLEKTIKTCMTDAFKDANDEAKNLISTLSGLGSAFDAINSAYVETQEEGFKSLSYEAVGSMQDKFGSLDGWDDFYKVATDTTSSVDQIRAAMNDLATEYIDSTDLLGQLTEANKDWTAQQLKSLGVENANEVVQSRLQEITTVRRAALEELKNANIDVLSTEDDFANMSLETIVALGNEVAAAGYTTEALYALALQKGYCNDSPIITDGDCSNVYDLMVAASKGKEGLLAYANTIVDANGQVIKTDGSIKNLQDLANAAYNAQNAAFKTFNPLNGTFVQGIKDVVAEVKNPYKFTGGTNVNAGTGAKVNYSGKKDNGSSNGTDKGSSNDFLKEYDNIQRKIENLQRKIDDTMNSMTDYSSNEYKQKLYKNTISYFNQQLSAYKKGLKYYEKERSKIKLSKSEKKIADKITKGDISITSIKDEKLADKLDKYLSLTDSINEINSAIIDVNTSLKDSKKAINELKLEKYQDDLSAIQARGTGHENNISLKQATGETVTKNDYSLVVRNLAKQKTNLESQKKLLQTMQKSYKKTSVEYQELQRQIESIDSSIADVTISQADWNKTINEMKLNSLITTAEQKAQALSKIQSGIDLKNAQGFETTINDYNSLVLANNAYVNALNNQLAEARKLQATTTVGSDLYKEYQSTIDSITDSITSANKAQVEYNNSIANLGITQLEKALSLLESVSALTKSAVDLKAARGNDLSEWDYEEQIRDSINEANNQSDQASRFYNKYVQAMRNGGAIDGKTAEEWLIQSKAAEASMNNTLASIESIKDAMRDDVYWRDLERAREELEAIQSKLSSLQSIVGDGDSFDKNGMMTESGSMRIALAIKEMETARSTIAQAEAEIDNLNKLYLEGQYTEQEYKSLLREKQQALLDSVNDLKSYQDNLIGIYEEQCQAQVDALTKVIEKRKELLQKEKEYYDYGRSMQNKVKTVKNLKQEIAALQSLSNAQDQATQSRIKALQAQLEEAEQDVQDTEVEHKITVITTGLDEMVAKIEETYDEYIEGLRNNLGSINTVVEQFATLFGSSINEAGNKIKEMLESMGVDTSKVGIDFGSIGHFSSGGLVKEIKKAGDSGLASLAPGEFVLNEELVKIFKGIIPEANNLYDNMSRVKTPDFSNIKSPQVAIYNNYDSLLHVDGNVDKDALPSLQEILKQSYEYSKQQDYVQSRKQGFKNKF